MITGYDIQYWFSDLWYDDLTHLGTASLPEVGFKLVVIFFGFLFTKAILGVLWRVFYVETLRHIIEPLFRAVTYPIRAPFLLWRSWRDRRRQQRDSKRRQQQREAFEREQRIAAEAERQRQEQSQMDELARLNNATRID